MTYHFPPLIIIGQKGSLGLIKRGKILDEVKVISTSESMRVRICCLQEEHLVRDAEPLWTWVRTR